MESRFMKEVMFVIVMLVLSPFMYAAQLDNVVALYNNLSDPSQDNVYEYNGVDAAYNGISIGAFPDGLNVAGLMNGNFAVSSTNGGVGYYSGVDGSFANYVTYPGFLVYNMTGLSNGNLAMLYDPDILVADDVHEVVIFNGNTGRFSGVRFSLGVGARDIAGLSNGKFAVSFDATGGNQIAVFNNDGTFVAQFAPGFAVNKMTGMSNGNIATVFLDGYLGNASQVVIYTSTGGYVTQFATYTNVLDIAGLANGRFAVSYEFGGSYGMSLFNNDGTYAGLAIAQGFPADQISGFPLGCISLPGDINQDCKVDFKDFAVMASEWLQCNLNKQSSCF